MEGQESWAPGSQSTILTNSMGPLAAKNSVVSHDRRRSKDPDGCLWLHPWIILLYDTGSVTDLNLYYFVDTSYAIHTYIWTWSRCPFSNIHHYESLPVQLTLYLAYSASFFSRNSVFLSQHFSQNSVFSHFQPSFSKPNGAHMKLFLSSC